MKLQVKRVNSWRALDGRYHSPNETVKQFFHGNKNELTPTTNCYYTAPVEWCDPNGGCARLLIEMCTGLSAGAIIWGVTVLVVTNYPGKADKYYVGRADELSTIFTSENDARWYCKDLLDAEYAGTLTIPAELL